MKHVTQYATALVVLALTLCSPAFAGTEFKLVFDAFTDRNAVETAGHTLGVADTPELETILLAEIDLFAVPGAYFIGARVVNTGGGALEIQWDTGVPVRNAFIDDFLGPLSLGDDIFFQVSLSAPPGSGGGIGGPVGGGIGGPGSGDEVVTPGGIFVSITNSGSPVGAVVHEAPEPETAAMAFLAIPLLFLTKRRRKS